MDSGFGSSGETFGRPSERVRAAVRTGSAGIAEVESHRMSGASAEGMTGAGIGSGRDL